MARKPYDYSTRHGVRPISWNDMHAICKGLAKAVATYEPQIILPIGRGGNYPGTLIAHMLRVEVYPVRVSRRVRDEATHDDPQWLIRPPDAVRGQRVLIVDEIVGSGRTIDIVREEAERLGALSVRSVVMYAHTWGVDHADYIGLISDELLLNPWDREVLVDGDFVFHPEYVEALGLQGIEAAPELLIGAAVLEPDKQPTQ